MPLTSARIRALNTVIDEGNYSAAARRLNMSQPAISQLIHGLEEAYGITLFERRGRNVIPTDLCLELAPLTDQIRGLEDAVEQVLQRNERVKTGVLRIGIGSLTPGMTLIGRFQQRYPGIQVQVTYGMHGPVTHMVLNGDVDVGILPNVPNDGRLESKVFLVQDIVALIPAGHVLSGSHRVSLVDLKNERLIFQKKGSETQKIVDAAFKNLGLKPHPNIVLEQGSEVYEAVASGLGIGFMWRYGTNRKDSVQRISIKEIEAVYEERIFRRADTTNGAIEAFFSMTDILSPVADRMGVRY